MRSLCLAATIILLTAVGMAQDEPVVAGKLYPYDTSRLHPSFAEFKGELLDAIEKDDLEFLASVLRPKDPGSLDEALIRSVGWQRIRDVLLLGATREAGGENAGKFCAPYILTRFPKEVAEYDYLVIIEEDIEVKAEPKSTAAVISHLSYDIVKAEKWHRTVKENIGGEEYRWQPIEMQSGKTGYVRSKYAHSPTDYFTACFGQLEGHWWLEYIVERH